MSVVSSSDNLPAIQNEVPVGLEDVNPSDLVTPRLTINHRDGEFVNSLTGETYSGLNGNHLEVVVLGLVKQRILWPPTMNSEDDPPLCKSLEFVNGRPSSNFPWSESGFSQADYTDLALPCDSCALREWGSHPNTNSPWCNEVHTYPILLPDIINPETGAWEAWSPCLFSVKSTGIKPSRTYYTSFSTTKQPMFIVTTKLSLQLNKKSASVTYCVPQFSRGTTTDPDNYQEWANQYRSIRTWLHTPREIEETTATPVAAPKTVSTATATKSKFPPDDEDF